MASSSNTSNSPIVTALFRDRQSAECAYNAISSRGYSKDDVNVMMSDETRQKHYSESGVANTELGSKALEGTGTGAGIGGTIGAVIGAIAAIGTSVLLPGLGLLVAGPLAGALVGAGAGGLTGGLIGALVGSGIPEETAQEYETGIKSGGTVLGVTPRSTEDAAFLQREFTNCGGTNVYSSAGSSTVATSTTTTTNNVANAPRNVASSSTQTDTVNRDVRQGETAIPVIEEELQVGKREVERGGVNVRTNVTEKPVEASVNLREEKVTVDRHPVDRAVSDADMAKLKDGSFTVTTKGEEAVVGKQARVVEEVVVGKEATERQETVRDTVKRTDVQVEETDKNVTQSDDFRNRKV